MFLKSSKVPERCITYSTAIATMTTNADIINPWSMGRKPELLISLKLVLSPMAASAATIKNLLVDFKADAILSENPIVLFITARAIKPNINHGMIFTMVRFAWIAL